MQPMENLRNLVLEATVEPEKFKFYKQSINSDYRIRYVYLHAPNDHLTKKVWFIADEGVIDENIKTEKYVFFENWEKINKEVIEEGFQQIYLKQFAAELWEICKFLEKELD